MEQQQLATHEAVIERGLQTFYDVGMALTRIRDQRLYRKHFDTFEDYCRERWGFQARQANLYMRAHEIVDNLKIGSIDPILPSIETHVRPLAVLDPDQQREAWKRAVETAPNGNVTALHVTKVVQEIRQPMSVHYSSATPEWYTPAHIIDRVLAFFDEIDLDPCSNSGPVPNVPARQVYTEADDGLEQPWFGRVYINPPYGDGIGRWTQKARDSYELGRNWDDSESEALRVEAAIMLLPARTDTAWFGHVQNYAVCFIRGRLTFVGASDPAPFPSMLVYLGDEIDRFAQVMAPLGRVWTARPKE